MTTMKTKRTSNSSNNKTFETVGIIGQWAAAITTGGGIAIEIALGGHIGYVLITVGALLGFIFTKIRHERLQNKQGDKISTINEHLDKILGEANELSCHHTTQSDEWVCVKDIELAVHGVTEASTRFVTAIEKLKVTVCEAHKAFEHVKNLDEESGE